MAPHQQGGGGARPDVQNTCPRARPPTRRVTAIACNANGVERAISVYRYPCCMWPLGARTHTSRKVIKPYRGGTIMDKLENEIV